MVTHHLAEFGDPWHSGTGDRILVCHLTSQDEAMKGRVCL